MVVVGGIVAAALFAIGAEAERRPHAPGRRDLDRRHALPWMAGTVILTVILLAAMSITIPIVIVGVTIYSGFAAFAIWRMATLDRASSWLPPSRRNARLAVSVIGLAWLGIVLGLLLWIADLLVTLATMG